MCPEHLLCLEVSPQFHPHGSNSLEKAPCKCPRGDCYEEESTEKGLWEPRENSCLCMRVVKEGFLEEVTS